LRKNLSGWPIEKNFEKLQPSEKKHPILPGCHPQPPPPPLWIQIPASRIIAHRAAHPDTFQSSHALQHSPAVFELRRDPIAQRPRARVPRLYIRFPRRRTSPTRRRPMMRCWPKLLLLLWTTALGSAPSMSRRSALPTPQLPQPDHGHEVGGARLPHRVRGRRGQHDEHGVRHSRTPSCSSGVTTATSSPPGRRRRASCLP
jgi:hypothetical protein